MVIKRGIVICSLIFISAPCMSMDLALRGYDFLMQHGDRMVDMAVGAFNLSSHMPQGLEPGQFRVPDHQPEHEARHGRETESRREHNPFDMLNVMYESNMRALHANFDVNGYLHSIADQLIAAHAPAQVEQRESSSELTWAMPSPAASDTIMMNAGEVVAAVLQDEFSSSSIAKGPKEATDSFPAESNSEPRFASEASFENRHAIELAEFATEPIERSADELAKNNEKIEGHNGFRVLEPEQAFEKLERLMSFSGNPAALGLQISFGRGKEHSIPKEILSHDLKNKLRAFFFDEKGHFKPIDSDDRQKEIAHILTPAFKNYFKLINKEQEYIPFLSGRNIHGAACFRDIRAYEAGDDDFIDYIGYGLSAVGSFLLRESLPKNEIEIAHSLFLSSAAQIIGLSKSGHVALAKEMLERLKDKINLETGSTITKSEYKCLEVILDAYQNKNLEEEKLKEAALVKALAQQAVLKSSQVPSVNQLPANSGGGMTPGDPEKDEEKLAELMEPDKTNLKETKIYRDAEQQIASNTKRFEMLDLKPISQGKLKHIVNKHTNVGEIARQRNMGNKGSIFNDDINLIELILDAYEFGTEIAEGTKIYDSGKIIGIHDKKGPTTIVIVGFDKIEKIIKTAFPG